jgi:hypothetical protein
MSPSRIKRRVIRSSRMFKLYSSELKVNYSWWSSRKWVTLVLHCAIYSAVITPRASISGGPNCHLGTSCRNRNRFGGQMSRASWWSVFFVFLNVETRGWLVIWHPVQCELVRVSRSLLLHDWLRNQRGTIESFQDLTQVKVALPAWNPHAKRVASPSNGL